jgi:pullulanase
MGHQPRAAMERLQRAVDRRRPHIHLIGEGWNFGEVADGARFVQASQLSLGGSGIATFSDRARDAVRGGGAATTAPTRSAPGLRQRPALRPNARAAGRATAADAAAPCRPGARGAGRHAARLPLHTHDGSGAC